MKTIKHYLSIILAICLLLCSTSMFTLSAAGMTDIEDIVVDSDVKLGDDNEPRPIMANMCSYTSPNQMMAMVSRGQAPSGVVAVHTAHSSNGLPHVHFTTGALNVDGTIHDGVSPTLTNDQRTWLQTNGWGVI